MQCRDFREMADSYLDDELLVETNHELFGHLEACAGCRRELAARRELRRQLRAGFTRAAELQPGDEFAARLRSNLKSRALAGTRVQPAWSFARLAVAASLLIVGATGLFALWQNRQSPTPAPVAVQRDADATHGSGEVVPSPLPPREEHEAAFEAASLAAGDHRDCAVDYRLPEEPIDIELAARQYDRAYHKLVDAVTARRGQAPGETVFVEAHSCVFEGRRFAHVVLKYRGRLVSLLVTSVRHAKESEQAAGGARVVACPPSGGYQVSCFETERHAVFVVSDLGAAENLSLAEALAPSVYEHLSRAERPV